MGMFRDQNVGQSHRTKADNSSFESVKEVKYLRQNFNGSKFYSGINEVQIEVTESLLSFGAVCYTKI